MSIKPNMFLNNEVLDSNKSTNCLNNDFLVKTKPVIYSFICFDLMSKI